jgi:predicted DNA-binding protein with PD1-like motif
MPSCREVKHAKFIMGRLAYGQDLLEELGAAVRDCGARLGRIEALGAVTRAVLGFYNQETRQYENHVFDQPLEITNFIGNISLKDGAPVIHAHVTLADEKGNAFGGHLCPGTTVFACEFVLQIFEGENFSRSHDAETDLPLWKLE